MMVRLKLPVLFSSVVVAATLTLTGCSNSDTPASNATQSSVEHAEHDHDEHGEHDHASAQHGGWWCGEHGVPEEECAQCDKSLVAEFKAEGDWCEEHNRPDSHCFIHHPENFEKYAALYEAKYGKRPEMPTQ